MKWLWNWRGTIAPTDVTLPSPAKANTPMQLKKGISEPVITLLDELKKDVWEVVHHKPQIGGSGSSWTLTHVYKEAVTFYVFQNASYDNVSWDLYGAYWMTDAEKGVVLELCKFVVNSQQELKVALDKINNRKAFARALGVKDETN